jgi:hypothetical protein
LYLALAALRLPDAVLAALAPLLLLGAGAVVAVSGWRYTRRASLDAVAREADVQGDLKDEAQSAYWFARQDATSAWEALMLRRAAQTLSRLDLRAVFPFRLPRSLRAAALLGAIVLMLAHVERDARQASSSALASAGGPQGEGRAAAGSADAALRFDAPAQAGSATMARKAGEMSIGARTPAQTSSDAQDGAVGQRATHAQDSKRGPAQVLSPAEQAIPGSPAGRDLLAQAAQVSAEVARGVLQRLESLLGAGGESKPAAAQAADQRQENSSAQHGEQQEAQRRDTDQDTTMDALNEALRALSQVATGDTPMGASPPGDGSQNNGRSNISGGAMGMRVDTTQAGPGGEDAPPDAPGEALGESALGKPTPRLAAQVQRLSAGVSPAEAEGAAEGFYVATRAQAARLDLTAAPAPARSAGEAALAREQVPVGYRGSVKRYFLTEHSKEP